MLAVDRPSWWRPSLGRGAWRLLSLSILVATGLLAAWPGIGQAAPFQRGDVFALGNGIVNEYSPIGEPQPDNNVDVAQLQQTIQAPGAAATECFDPSGRHLIIPGAGLFDTSGNLLPSNWASVPAGGTCVADGFGHVYVSGGVGPYPPVGPWTVKKYDIAGNPLQAMNISIAGFGPLAIDLAPDECTLYYTGWLLEDVDVGRFNVCTNTQEPPFIPGGVAGIALTTLRVLPNWQVLTTGYSSAGLFDTSAQSIRGWGISVFVSSGNFSSSLDPDGTSFWTGGVYETQVDLNSSQVLQRWVTVPGFGTNQPAGGFIAVYGPPLFGDADVERKVDSNTAGTAEAFRTRVRFSGQMARLHLWVDSTSTATQAVVGIYSDHLARPGALLEEGTITDLLPGSWNYADLPSLPVTAGQHYWIAVLAPKASGTLAFRDRTLGGLARVSAQHNLTALPKIWSNGRHTLSGRLSAYGS